MRGSPVWTSRTMATWPGRTSSGRTLSQPKQKVSVQELKVSFLRIPELAINPLGDRIVHAFFYESKSQGEEKVDFKVSSQVEIMWGGGWARKSDKERSRQVFRRVQKNNVESGWRLGVTGTGHPKLKTSPDFTTTAPQPHQLPLTYTTTQLKPYFVPSWHWIQKIIPGIKSKYFCCAHHHDKIGPWIDLEAFLETVKFAEWQLFHLVISSKCFPAICIPLTQTYLWHSMNKKQSAWVCWHVPIKLQSGSFCPKSKHLSAKIDQLETSDLLKG